MPSKQRQAAFAHSIYSSKLKIPLTILIYNIMTDMLQLQLCSPPILLSRLLVLLGVADLVHLVTSLLSFSLPTLSPTFHTHSYLHTLPFTLPLAQVSGPSNTVI